MIFNLLWEQAYVACVSQGFNKKKINTINIIWKPRNNNIFLRKENNSNNNKHKTNRKKGLFNLQLYNVVSLQFDFRRQNDSL